MRHERLEHLLDIRIRILDEVVDERAEAFEGRTHFEQGVEPLQQVGTVLVVLGHDARLKRLQEKACDRMDLNNVHEDVPGIIILALPHEVFCNASRAGKIPGIIRDAEQAGVMPPHLCEGARARRRRPTHGELLTRDEDILLLLRGDRDKVEGRRALHRVRFKIGEPARHIEVLQPVEVLDSVPDLLLSVQPIRRLLDPLHELGLVAFGQTERLDALPNLFGLSLVRRLLVALFELSQLTIGILVHAIPPLNEQLHAPNTMNQQFGQYKTPSEGEGLLIDYLYSHFFVSELYTVDSPKELPFGKEMV